MQENTSGYGDRCASVPIEIENRWNWGAFLFPVIWGLCHHVYQALWCFVPIVGLFYPFYLAKSANALAWKARYYESAEAFLRTERRWAMVSIAITLALFALRIGTCAAEQKQQAREDAAYEAMQVVLRENLFASKEWKEIVGDRELWTNDLHTRYGENAVLNAADALYLEPDRYYRIHSAYHHDYGTSGVAVAENGAVLFSEDDLPIDYTVTVELSNGEWWVFLCHAEADGTIRSAEPQQNAFLTAERQAYAKASVAAPKLVKAYADARLAEVIESDLWTDTIGAGYTIESCAPYSVDYAPVYEGGEPVCEGLDAAVTAEDGARYHVFIGLQMHESGETTELPLEIKPIE